MEQLISISIRLTNKTSILIYNALTNTSQNVSHCGVIALGISDHYLVYCKSKTSSLKLNKHNDILIRSMKNYTKEKFLELLGKTDFPDYITFTCLNQSYQDFIFKLSEVI